MFINRITRFMLITALLYATFYSTTANGQAAVGVSSGQPSDAKVPAAANAQPNRQHDGQRLPVPTDADPAGWHDPSPQLYDIKMTSATNGWVVGASGTILRYTGGQWLNVTSPTLNALRSVDGSDSEAWAVGDNATALHWQGNDWEILASPPASVNSLYKVAAVAPGQMYALGRNSDSIYGGFSTISNYLFKYSAGQWQVVNSWRLFYQDPDYAEQEVRDMAWAGPDDGVIVGYEQYQEYHYDPYRYDIFSPTLGSLLPPPGSPYSRTLTALTRPAADDIWLVSEGTPNLLHYTGGSWQTVTPTCGQSPATVKSILAFVGGVYYASAECDNLPVLLHDQTATRTPRWFTHISGMAGNDLWLMDFDSIYHWDGSSFSQAYQVPPIIAPNGEAPKYVQMLSADEGWGQGEYYGYPQYHGGLYHYTGTLWLRDTSVTTDVTATAFASSSDGWARTTHGFIHYDGSGWSAPQFIDDNYNFTAMQMISPTEGWAVGKVVSGTLGNYVAAAAHYHDGTWQPTMLGTGNYNYLTALSFDRADDGWVVGRDADTGGGLVYHYSGQTWQRITDPTLNQCELSGVSALASNRVWMVGRTNLNYHLYSCVMHWDGYTWDQQLLPGTLAAIQMLSPTDGWAVGYGIIAHYQYGTWQTIGTDATLTGLSFGSAEDGWAVGGPLLHYHAQCNDYYTDVPPDHFAYTAVLYLSCHGIVAGTGNRQFSPAAPATRIQFAKMISLARGWPLTTPTNQTFSDVSPSHPLYAFVETAHAHGAINGANAQTCAAHNIISPCFLPNSVISRAQTAIIIQQAYGWPTDTNGGPHFSDVHTDNYAYAAVETCYHYGVVNGIGGGLFAPNADVTRAQIAVMLYRALNLP